MRVGVGIAIAFLEISAEPTCILFPFLLTVYPSHGKVSRRGKMILKVASLKKVRKRNISRVRVHPIHCHCHPLWF